MNITLISSAKQKNWDLRMSFFNAIFIFRAGIATGYLCNYSKISIKLRCNISQGSQHSGCKLWTLGREAWSNVELSLILGILYIQTVKHNIFKNPVIRALSNSIFTVFCCKMMTICAESTIKISISGPQNMENLIAKLQLKKNRHYRYCFKFNFSKYFFPNQNEEPVE